MCTYIYIHMNMAGCILGHGLFKIGHSKRQDGLTAGQMTARHGRKGQDRTVIKKERNMPGQ